jgi:hypothetical protein
MEHGWSAWSNLVVGHRTVDQVQLTFFHAIGRSGAGAIPAFGGVHHHELFWWTLIAECHPKPDRAD